MTTLAPIHPGEHLVEILDELHISQDHLAQAMGVTQYASTKSSTTERLSQPTWRCGSEKPWE